MTEIRRLLSESTGTPLTYLLERGLVSESVRALIAHRAKAISVHSDRAAKMAVARRGAHACCLGNRVFLGPTIGTSLGPTLSDALHHELIHLAQVELAQRTGRMSSLDRVEAEAMQSARPGTGPVRVLHGADPNDIYNFWWLIPVAAAAYVLLRPNVANAPAPGGKTYPSVSEAQVAGEALALFAVPEASFAVAGRLGLAFYGSLAVAGATSTMSYRGVQDVAAGEFSGVQTYVIDGATGAIIGVVVPGGIRLAKGGAIRSLDWLATQGMRRSDFAITEALAQRSAQTPVTAEELARMFQSRNSTGRAAEWWLNRRGQIILYRGQGAPSVSILSPMARTSGLEASEQLVARMRAAGLADEEIAGYTARWHNQPVPNALAPPGLGGEPLGAAGIPTSRIPGIAANFGESGVVYIIRLPKSAAIQVPQWGLSVENEWVVLNQIPSGSIIETIPATRLPALEVDAMGRLIPGTRGVASASSAVTPELSNVGLPELITPRLPLFGVPPIFNPPAEQKPFNSTTKQTPTPNPPGAGMLQEETICVRPNSDYINPVCSTTRTYIVKNGDSLWALAQRFYGDGRQHPKIYQANRALLGPQPANPRLVPGQRLTIP